MAPENSLSGHIVPLTSSVEASKAGSKESDRDKRRTKGPITRIQVVRIDSHALRAAPRRAQAGLLLRDTAGRKLAPGSYT